MISLGTDGLGCDAVDCDWVWIDATGGYAVIGQVYDNAGGYLMRYALMG